MKQKSNFTMAAHLRMNTSLLEDYLAYKHKIISCLWNGYWKYTFYIVSSLTSIICAHDTTQISPIVWFGADESLFFFLMVIYGCLLLGILLSSLRTHVKKFGILFAFLCLEFFIYYEQTTKYGWRKNLFVNESVSFA